MKWVQWWAIKTGFWSSCSRRRGWGELYFSLEKGKLPGYLMVISPNRPSDSIAVRKLSGRKSQSVLSSDGRTRDVCWDKVFMVKRFFTMRIVKQCIKFPRAVQSSWRFFQDPNGKKPWAACFEITMLEERHWYIETRLVKATSMKRRLEYMTHEERVRETFQP